MLSPDLEKRIFKRVCDLYHIDDRILVNLMLMLLWSVKHVDCLVGTSLRAMFGGSRQIGIPIPAENCRALNLTSLHVACLTKGRWGIE
jgi:hypothetical protein